MPNQKCILSPPNYKILQWLANCLKTAAGDIGITALAGDAGFRRYYRVQAAGQSFILMIDEDADQRQRFLAVHAQLQNAQIGIPAIIAQSDELPCLLLEDLGEQTFHRALPPDELAWDAHYQQAIAVLLKIQTAPLSLPPYHRTALAAETHLFSDWYCDSYLKKPLTPHHRQQFEQCSAMLHEAMGNAPQCPVHRDFHSRNLMYSGVATSEAGDSQLAVIDFQDAVIGCCAYDIVSLLKDAYVAIPVPQQQRYLESYWKIAQAHRMPLGDSFSDFIYLFNVTAIQRGLKVLGIFARLSLRDNKHHYLSNMPLVYQHLQDARQALTAAGANIPLDFLQHYPPPCKQ